jgi:hypothetical protein
MVAAQFLLVLCAVFTAFCIWLTVQVVNRPERWLILPAVNLIVVIAAFAGFCWLLFSRFGVA